MRFNAIIFQFLVTLLCVAFCLFALPHITSRPLFALSEAGARSLVFEARTMLCYIGMIGSALFMMIFSLTEPMKIKSQKSLWFLGFLKFMAIIFIGSLFLCEGLLSYHSGFWKPAVFAVGLTFAVFALVILYGLQLIPVFIFEKFFKSNSKKELWAVRVGLFLLFQLFVLPCFLMLQYSLYSLHVKPYNSPVAQPCASPQCLYAPGIQLE